MPARGFRMALLRPESRPAASRARLADRLVAEGVRLHEERTGEVIDERHAWQQGLAAGGELEERILARAAASRFGGEMREAVARQRGVLASILLLAAVLAMLSGIATAGVVFGAAAAGMRDGLNVLWALGTLLGLQTILLVVWLLLMLLAPRSGGGALGAIVIRAGTALARRLHRDEASTLAVVAWLRWTGRAGATSWAAGLLTHLLWAAFGIGAMLMTLWTLALRQVDFVWGTTILTEGAFVTLIGALAALPAALGLSVPDEALVQASRLGVETMAEERRAWSVLLFSSLAFYGVLPRLLLALLCAARLYRRLMRLSLDLREPGYARLAARLMPASRSLGVVDPAAGVVTERGRAGRRHVAPGGHVLLIWLALSPERAESLARLGDGRLTALGDADARESRARVLAELAAWRPAPALVVVVSSLLRTPDRHFTTLLDQLRHATPAPVWLVLGEADQAGALGVDVAARREAWQRLAGQAGIDHVIVESAESAADGDLGGLFAELDLLEQARER